MPACLLRYLVKRNRISTYLGVLEGIGYFNVALCGNHGRSSVAPALDIAVPRSDPILGKAQEE